MYRVSLIVISLILAIALCPTDAIAQDEEKAGDVRQDSAQDEQPIERRNPRRVRRSRGQPAPPRMVAGGIGVGSGDDLRPYRKLEPIIGEFAFHGVQWRTPGTQDTSEFTGVWTNSWKLDGYYMRSEFRIETMRPEYVVMGLTWWDSEARRFESHFYNSRSTLRTHRFGSFDETGSNARHEEPTLATARRRRLSVEVRH